MHGHLPKTQKGSSWTKHGFNFFSVPQVPILVQLASVLDVTADRPALLSWGVQEEI